MRRARRSQRRRRLQHIYGALPLRELGAAVHLGQGEIARRAVAASSSLTRVPVSRASWLSSALPSEHLVCRRLMRGACAVHPWHACGVAPQQ